MRSVCSISLVMVGVATSVVCAATALQPQTRALLDSTPGLRVMTRGERLAALYGTSMAIDADPTTSTDDFVSSFIINNKSAFGVSSPRLVFGDKRTTRSRKFTVYTYVQEIEGLPVWESLVRIPVLLGATEKIGYAGIRLVRSPVDPLPIDLVSAPAAVALVSDDPAYAYMTEFTAPVPMVFEDVAGKLHRVFRFEGYGRGEPLRFFVDTNSGVIIETQKLSFTESISGTVTGWQTPCCRPGDADYGEFPACCATDTSPRRVGVAGAHVTILPPDEPICSTVDGNVAIQLTTDRAGFFQVHGMDLPVRVIAHSQIDLATVFDCIVSSFGVPFDHVWCATNIRQGGMPGAELLRIRECTGADDASELPIEFPDSDVAVSAVNALLGVQEMHDWLQMLQPDYPGLDEPIKIGVGASGVNAQAWPGRILTFSSGFAANTVIAHEYGHLMHGALGIWTDADIRRQAFAEGIADAVAVFASDGPFVGHGTMFARDIDYDVSIEVVEGLCDGQSMLPAWCNNCDDPHCGGIALAGAFWDFRRNLIDRFENAGDDPMTALASAKAIADERLIDFLFVTSGLLDQSTYIELLIADDDDADLANGTPNRAEIDASFVDRHGWDPLSHASEDSVKVEWFGPVATPPEEGVDYFVEYDTSPPNVVLKTTEVLEEGTFAGVQRWRVGRVVDGQAADLGLVTADWEGTAHDIIVEVGSPNQADPNIKCRSVGVVDIPAQGNENWSGVELYLAGDVIARVRAYAAVTGAQAGVGGRVSGRVEGNVARVVAKAIGMGASLPGTFAMGPLRSASIDTVPEDSTLRIAKTIGYTNPLVVVHREFHGLIETTEGKLYMRVEGRAASTGSIHIEGDIPSDAQAGRVLEILGDMTGDILVTGAANGDIAVDGMFDGEFCASNVLSGGPLPSNVEFALLGPNARICGAEVCAAVESAGEELNPIPRNRYLTFDAPRDPTPMAIRVKIVNSAGFAGSAGEIRWVGPPQWYSEGPTGGQFQAAKLQCSPYFMDWSGVGTLNAYGREVVPAASYEIRAVARRSVGMCASSAITVSTGRWGDVTGPFDAELQPSMADMNAVVQKYKAMQGSGSKAELQLAPEAIDPAAEVSFMDILAAVQAFQGERYPYAGPQACGD